jgi:hypothetical protein
VVDPTSVARPAASASSIALEEVNPAGPVGRGPVALIEDQYGPHFPPDRCGVDPTAVDYVIMVWGRHEDRRGRRARLPQRIQSDREVYRRGMHGACAGHGIIRIWTPG